MYLVDFQVIKSYVLIFLIFTLLVKNFVDILSQDLKILLTTYHLYFLLQDFLVGSTSRFFLLSFYTMVFNST